MKKILLVLVICISSLYVYADGTEEKTEIVNGLDALDISIEIDQYYDVNAQNQLYQYGLVDVGYTLDFIDFFWNFSVCNDDKYEPSEDYFFGYYIYMENAGLAFDFETMNLTLGRTTLTDIVDSPYSLFVSSKIIPALLADYTFDDGTFFFTTRWTSLNSDSSLYIDDGESIDRGWQYNTYGVYIDDWRIGFQDSIVYTSSTFSPEYFFNPLPGFFKQYCLYADGTPWESGSNANSIMGFFVEYSPENLYSYAQILIDDFNANAFLNPDSFQNPNKIAWSLGGRYSFDFGDIGFYHVGATKYTFQSFGTSTYDTYYGYSFYLDVTYSANGVIMPIELEDTYLGYYNGENNISFLVDYEGTIEEIGIYSSLELTISGDKSPANPWDEYNSWTEDTPAGTHLLDSDVLEKKLVLTAGAARALPELGLPDLTVSMSLEIGYIWNVLELTDTLASDYTQIQYWSPSDNNELVFSISLGAIYSF